MMTTGTDYRDKLNKIVFCNESLGVVKYVGPLDNPAEIWLGIEWKDFSRGKHNGSYKGQQYFNTRHPTGGSFVKPSKVEFGIDIWQAILNKYFDAKEVQSLENTSDKDKDHFLYNNFNLIKSMVAIKCVNLAFCKISCLDGIDTMSAQFPHLTELDLECNLLNSWSQVFHVLDTFKKIQIINISNNILDFDGIESPDHIYPNVRHLILNRMDYNWNQILRVVKHFPSVVELKVCYNQITEIDEIDANLIEKLQVLDLESNPVKDWSHLLKFGQLKELETLYVNNIGLKEIAFDDCGFDSHTKHFAKLKSISLNDNLIDNWSPVNELDKLKSLQEIRFRFNPLNNQDTPENVREMFIAKLPRIVLLNRTKINKNEHLGAEYDYLKRYGIDWFEVTEGKDINGQVIPAELLEKKKQTFYRDHPRYALLVKKYGAVEKCELNPKTETLKSNLLAINIKNDLTGEMLQKKLPSSIDIQRLKVLISKLFKSTAFDFESLKLFYFSSKNPSNEFELDNDYRTLGFYAVENEDTIVARKVC